MLIDTFENKFDIAMVFTNDSDFLEPLKKIKKKFKKTIYLINPNQHYFIFSRQRNWFFKDRNFRKSSWDFKKIIKAKPVT